MYSRTPRSYLAKYVVNGQVMALPGRGWPVDLGRGPVTWHSNAWIQRLDVMEALGTPKTHDDLLENLRAIRDGDFPDLEAIYGAKHDRWVEWITANGFDDRDSLLTVTPLPEWKEVMGW